MEPEHLPSCLELETKIHECLEQRRRVYHHKLAITVRWEDDKTNAIEDFSHFKEFATTLGIKDVHECRISGTDIAPSIYVEEALASYMKSGFEAQQNGSYLVIIHYAGCGDTDPERGQFFCPTEGSRRRFYLRSLLHHVSTFAEIDGPAVDLVLIIDSSYFATTLPAIQPKSSQTIELLAAVASDENGFPKRSAATTNTFTSRIAKVLAQWKENCLRDMNFATLLAVAQEDEAILRPVHKFLAGRLPVKTGIPPYENNLPICYREPRPEPVPGQRDVLMACSVVDGTGLVNVRRLSQWVESLDPCIGVHVDRVYKCVGNIDSIGMLLRVPFHVFCTLEPLPKVKMITRKLLRYQGYMPIRSPLSDAVEVGPEAPTSGSTTPINTPDETSCYDDSCGS